MAKFCSNCGNQVDEKAVVCVKCGVSLKNEPIGDTSNAKSKIAAGLLGIFLGTFGIHNFYLGYKSKALTQLLLTVLSCGILSFITGIWGLIEGIMILAGSINVDADGNPLRD
jgi:TM2 domain-containing membrane protein YozV